MVKLIFLTGMPGSGKSTSGKLLAEKLGYTFVDLDQEIEKSKEKPIKQIFEEEGENTFRQVEHESLMRLIQEAKLNTVISLGGGTIAHNNNIDPVKKSGTLIYLEVKPQILVERLKNETANRPLFNATDPELKINLLLSLREHFYKQAHISIDANGKPEETVSGICSLLGKI
jgi:shikimate kinase